MTNLSRRGVLAAAAAAAAAPFVAGQGAQAKPTQPKTWDLTLLGTSDTHGNVYNWDYYKDAEYDDGAHNDVGLAKVATLVNAVRAERRGKATLVLDAGDTIQGTPLATYYAKQEPITTTREQHPMARAMNVIRYDAVTLGNHEFNYGLPLLDLWIRQLGFPALAANAVNVKTGRPAFLPYVIKKVKLGEDAPQLRVGILGLTNPGIAIWDRANVEGKLRFDDMVATAAKYVPQMRDRGADIILISAHGGDSGTSSYGPSCRTRTRRRSSPSRCPASTRSCSATPTTTSRSGSSPTPPPGRRCCCPSRRSGASGSPGWTSRSPATGAAGRSPARQRRPSTPTRWRPTRSCSPPCASSTTRRSPTSTSRWRPRCRSCRRSSRGTRTRRSSTTSTRCRPTS
ncbi:metallophosphoesterase [Dactylosporangium darangshiense]|uniref:metallophosphoesterase n=1 Tax=Dactylosporangium darangshiense TaxID=579108 RepID=UPI003634D957